MIASYKDEDTERFAMGVALAEVDIGEPISWDRSAQDHAFGCAGAWKQPVYDRFEGPPVGPGQLGVRGGDLPGIEVESISLQAAWILGGSSFGNYTKGPAGGSHP